MLALSMGYTYIRIKRKRKKKVTVLWATLSAMKGTVTSLIFTAHENLTGELCQPLIWIRSSGMLRNEQTWKVRAWVQVYLVGWDWVMRGFCFMPRTWDFILGTAMRSLLLHCSAVHLRQFKEEFKLECSRLECGGKAGRPGEWLQKSFCVHVWWWGWEEGLVSSGQGGVETVILGGLQGSCLNGQEREWDRHFCYILRVTFVVNFFQDCWGVKEKKQKFLFDFLSSPVPQLNSPDVAPIKIVSSLYFQKFFSEKQGVGGKRGRLA